MRRRLAIGALLMLMLSGCGSSGGPKNGLILAWKNEGHGGSLYVMNPDGSGLRRVPHSTFTNAVWTPDGKWIAYNTAKPVTDRSGSYAVYDLWLMRSDGSERHRVAKNVPPGEISPDGKTIAFMDDSCAGVSLACEDSVDNPMEVYVVGMNGEGRRRLTYNMWYDGDPSWSPDGKRIAFDTDFGPRIMDRDGSNWRVLEGAGWAAPLWSPRDDRILISGAGGWALVSPEGGKPHYLKRGPRGPEWGAAWSPDGRKIVYMGKRARVWTAEEPMQLWVMNADGTGRHPITHTVGWAAPSWAPGP